MAFSFKDFIRKLSQKQLQTYCEQKDINLNIPENLKNEERAK